MAGRRFSVGGAIVCCGVALVAAGPATAQETPDGDEDLRNRAESSVARQLAAVREQSRAAREAIAGGVARQLDSTRMQLAAAQPSPRAFLHFKKLTFPAATPPVGVNCPPAAAGDVDGLIERAAKRYDLSRDLLYSVIRQESAFDPCAVSHKGALGLMQLMPETAALMGVRNPFDPKENIDGGARYLRRMLTSFDGDLGLALAAYNAGPAAVERYQGRPPYHETQNYVAAILRSLAAAGAQSD